VAGLDDVRLARTDLDLGAVLVPDRQQAVVDEGAKPAVAHRSADTKTRHDVLRADRPDDGDPLND
jgi:hypothetical protein